MDSTDGLVRGMEVVDTGAPITVPVGEATLGRIFNVIGETIDKGGPSPAEWNAGRSTAPAPAFEELEPTDRDLRDRHQGRRPARPVRQGRQDRPLRRRRRRQDGHHSGADPQHRHRARRLSPSSAGVGERTREGNDLWLEMKESGVIDKTAMVFGQMNEPPGARLRVGLTGLTMAEYFRDDGGQDVLLFIDNIFRFAQAGSEVSALLGRMPSAVGYQPTLATEMGELQERITSTKRGSITSVQAIYVPADDLTDPAPADDLRAPRRHDGPLARDLREGHLPGRRPARLHLAHPRPATSSARSTTTSPARAARSSSATRTCRTSSRSSAWTSSRTKTSSSCTRARKIERFLSPAVLRRRGLHRHCRASTCR